MKWRGWIYHHLLLPRSLKRVNAAIAASQNGRYVFVDARTFSDAVDFLTATRGSVEMWRNPRLHGDMVEWDRQMVLIKSGTGTKRFVTVEGWGLNERKGDWSGKEEGRRTEEEGFGGCGAAAGPDDWGSDLDDGEPE